MKLARLTAMTTLLVARACSAQMTVDPTTGCDQYQQAVSSGYENCHPVADNSYLEQCDPVKYTCYDKIKAVSERDWALLINQLSEMTKAFDLLEELAKRHQRVNEATSDALAAMQAEIYTLASHTAQNPSKAKGGEQ